MKRKIRLTESELTRLIKRVISEQTTKQVTVTVDCTKKAVDGFTGIADGFFTKHCGTAQAGTTTQAGAGTTPLDTYVRNMVNWRASVIDDKIQSITGAWNVDVGGDEDTKKVSRVSIQIRPEKILSSGSIATPTYNCQTGTADQYQQYFKAGSEQYKLFVEAAKLQCQASQKKIQEVKFTKQ